MRKALQWYPIFLREMLLYRRRLLRLGYLASTMFVPIIYLVAFGFGLGRNVNLQGGSYIDFLIPGLVAMSSMINTFMWVANSLNLDRVYFKTFQVFVQAPLRPSAILTGEVLASVVKGLLTSTLIVAVGYATSRSFSISVLFVIALLLNCFLFANLGVLTGMLSRSHEDIGTYSNFFILPMAFFSGTFFPVEDVPALLKALIYIMPLTHVNLLMRKISLDNGAVISLSVLIIYTLVFFLCSIKVIKDYSE